MVLRTVWTEDRGPDAVREDEAAAGAEMWAALRAAHRALTGPCGFLHVREAHVEDSVSLWVLESGRWWHAYRLRWTRFPEKSLLEEDWFVDATDAAVMFTGAWVEAMP